MKPSTRRTLAILRRGPATTHDLLMGGAGSRYSARIMELRNLGAVIEAERIREGSWKYTLTTDIEAGSGEGPSRPQAPALPPEPEPAAASLGAGGRLFDFAEIDIRPAGSYRDPDQRAA